MSVALALFTVISTAAVLLVALSGLVWWAYRRGVAAGAEQAARTADQAKVHVLEQLLAESRAELARSQTTWARHGAATVTAEGYSGTSDSDFGREGSGRQASPRQRPKTVQGLAAPGAWPEREQVHRPIGPTSIEANSDELAEDHAPPPDVSVLADPTRRDTRPRVSPDSSGPNGRPGRRSLAQAFTDGIGSTLDIFGGIERQRWRSPVFEDTLGQDARELCHELGLTILSTNDSDEEKGR